MTDPVRPATARPRRWPAGAKGALAAALITAVAASVAAVAAASEAGPAERSVGSDSAQQRPGGSATAEQQSADPAPTRSSSRSDRPAGSETSAAVARPSWVSIPAIGVRTSLERLGYGKDGELQAPRDPERAGWFAAGTRPGAAGPAVVAGHVDSRDGPAVFWRLRELRPGDVVRVGRADGTVARFVVHAVERHRKDRFPTEAVYGPTPDVELRLITCSGPYDVGSGYRENLVVYALAKGGAADGWASAGDLSPAD